MVTKEQAQAVLDLQTTDNKTDIIAEYPAKDKDGNTIGTTYDIASGGSYKDGSGKVVGDPYEAYYAKKYIDSIPTPVTIASITISYADPTLINGSKDSEVLESATITYSDGSVSNDHSILTFTSSDTTQATVSNDASSKGVVEIAVGTATDGSTVDITASVDGVVSNTVTFTITVS